MFACIYELSVLLKFQRGHSHQHSARDDVIENLYNNAPEGFSWKIPKNRLFKFSGEFGTTEVFEYLRRIERVSDNQDADFDPTKFE